MKFLGVICSGLLWDAVRRKSPAIGEELQNVLQGIAMAGDFCCSLWRGARDCRYGVQLGSDDRNVRQAKNHLP